MFKLGLQAAQLPFNVDLNHAELHEEMIAHYTTYLLEANDQETEQLEVRRSELKAEAEHYHQRSGPYARKCLSPWLNHPDTKPSIDGVVNWLSATGWFAGRIPWFDYNAPRSKLFFHCGRPLLSMRTVMSMTCERHAKPLKYVVYGLNRHRTTVRNAERYLRCHLQLKAQMARNIEDAEAEAAAELEAAL